jgi:hypothetical protein
MNNTNSTISQIEAKISELHSDQIIASGLLNHQKESNAIDDYTRLQQDTTVRNGVRYVALGTLAQEYQLYSSIADKQKLTDIIGQSLSECSLSETFDSLQLLKSNYAAIYKVDPTAFNRVEKLVRGKLEIPLMEDISLHPKPAILGNQVQPPAAPLPQPSRNLLIIGVFLIGLLMALLSVSINNNSKTVIQSNASSSPIDQNPSSTQPISSSSSTSQDSPEALITQYYRDINSRKYQLAWDKLPTNLQRDQNIHPNGYQSFSEFFDKFDGVNVNNLTTIEKTEYYAVVGIDLDCQFNKENRKSPLYLRFFLSRSSNNQIWQISKIKLNPDRKSFCGTG